LLNFLWLALGIGSLLVALALCLVLLRLNRTLAVVEETLVTADEAMKELVPEVKTSLGNVNDITAAVNVGLRAAGAGTARLGLDVGERTARSGRGLKAAMFGARVAIATLLNSSEKPAAVSRKAASGGRSDG
jgi:hypothetical protein